MARPQIDIAIPLGRCQRISRDIESDRPPIAHTVRKISPESKTVTVAVVTQTEINAPQTHGRAGLAVIEPLQLAVFAFETPLLEQPADQPFILPALDRLQRIETGDAETSVGQPFQRQTRVHDHQTVDFEISPEQRQ